jgi:hypothetical protein
VRLECLPGSSLPDELRKAGYILTEEGSGERILHSAIIEMFTTGADGTLEPLIAGSTRLIALVVAHAGICKVKRYAFDMP